MKTPYKFVLFLVAHALLNHVSLGADDVSTISAILADQSPNNSEPLNASQTGSINTLSPKETAGFLMQAARDRVGTEYAKDLIFAAALTELLYPTAESGTVDQVRSWVRTHRREAVEFKMFTAFSTYNVTPQERLAALQSLIAHYEKPGSERWDPKYRVYDRLLVRGFPGVPIVELLKLKELELLIDSGKKDLAADKIDESACRPLSPACREYLGTLRLRLQLQAKDKPIWKK